MYGKYDPFPFKSIYLIHFLTGSVLISPRTFQAYVFSRSLFIWIRCLIRYTHSSVRFARYAAVIRSMLAIIASEILSAFIGSCTDPVYPHSRSRSFYCLQHIRMASLTHLLTVRFTAAVVFCVRHHENSVNMYMQGQSFLLLQCPRHASFPLVAHPIQHPQDTLFS